MINANTGNHIRMARKYCGITQKQLSDYTGVKLTDISKIEKGHLLDETLIRRLARQLGIVNEIWPKVES